MEVKGRGQKALVEFTMHSKEVKKDFTMHSKEDKKEFTMHSSKKEKREEIVQPAEAETREEEKLDLAEASVILVTDSDDSDTEAYDSDTEAYDSDTEDMLVPEVLMNLTADSCDSDTENMPTPELPMILIFE